MTFTLSATTLLWFLVLATWAAFGAFAWKTRNTFLSIRADLLEVNGKIAAEILKVEEKYSAINLRVVDLETEPSQPAIKEEQDMMATAHSWLSQAAAAERGEGVRI